MGILLGFLPFITFSLLTGLSVSLALWLAFAAAFALSIRDFLHAKMVRTLDLGCLALFSLLAIYTGFIQPELPVPAVRFVADIGLLLIAVISTAMRNPFTLQYARDQYPEKDWDTPDFLHANYILSGVWIAVFFLTATADGFATFGRIKLSFVLDVATTLAVLAAAIVFTVRYPSHPHLRNNTR